MGHFRGWKPVKPKAGSLERAMGIEPTSEAWEASILPLYDARSCANFADYTQLRGHSHRPATALGSLWVSHFRHAAVFWRVLPERGFYGKVPRGKPGDLSPRAVRPLAVWTASSSRASLRRRRNATGHRNSWPLHATTDRRDFPPRCDATAHLQNGRLQNGRLQTGRREACHRDAICHRNAICRRDAIYRRDDC